MDDALQRQPSAKRKREVVGGLQACYKRLMLKAFISEPYIFTSRLSTGAQEKKRFMNWCQDVGILEVLPYHECDHLSRDQPDYLTCLVRLQLQNISSRYPVFITGETQLHEYVHTFHKTRDMVV